MIPRPPRSTRADTLFPYPTVVGSPRTAAGWRIYGPAEMARAREIATLRGFGLSLARIALVLDGDPGALAQALTAHPAVLEQQIRRTAGTVETLRGLCAENADGHTPTIGPLARLGPQPWAAAPPLRPPRPRGR